MDQKDRIDLSSVNKTKKQIKLPKITNPLKKKSAGPGRDQFGQFTSGSGGLQSFKKFNWGRALPLILIVALAGGYMVYRSFAGSSHACHFATGDPFQVQESCLRESDEAKVIRLYFGILNRNPDPAGRDYWASRLRGTTAPKLTLTQVAKQFMGSAEFKNKYGNLTNQKFVEAMYPQIFGRSPDVAGLKYWVDRLNAKSISREAMIVSFTESPEMKEAFSTQVAVDLGMINFISTKVKTYSPSEIICYGNKRVDPGTKKTVCSVDISAKSGDSYSKVVAGGANLPVDAAFSKGNSFMVCATVIHTKSQGEGLAFTEIFTQGSTDKIMANPAALYTYSDPGGRGSSASSDGRRCANMADIPSGMQSWHLTFAKENRNYSGTASFALDNITLYRRNSNRVSARQQESSLLQQAPASKSDAPLMIPKTSLPGNLASVPVYEEVRSRVSYRALPTSTQPVWSSTHNAFVGLNEIQVFSFGQRSGHELYPSEKVKAEYIITDLSTKKRIPVDHYLAVSVDQNGVDQSRVIGREQVLTYTNNQQTAQSIIPVFKLGRPAKVKIEVKVYEGKIDFNGGVSVDWQKPN